MTSSAYSPSSTLSWRAAESNCCRRCCSNASAFVRLSSASRRSSGGRMPASNRPRTRSADSRKLSTVVRDSSICCCASATANHAFAVWPAIESCAARRSAADACRSASTTWVAARSRPQRSISHDTSSDTPWLVKIVLRTSSSAPGIGKPTKFCRWRAPVYEASTDGNSSARAVRASEAAISSRAAAACRLKLPSRAASTAAFRPSSPKSCHQSTVIRPSGVAAAVHVSGTGTPMSGAATGAAAAHAPAPPAAAASRTMRAMFLLMRGLRAPQSMRRWGASRAPGCRPAPSRVRPCRRWRNRSGTAAGGPGSGPADAPTARPTS